MVTIIRFPCGVIASLVVIGFWMILFPLEIILVVLMLPFGAIFMSRSTFKESWLGQFPNTIRNMKSNLVCIWRWVFVE